MGRWLAGRLMKELGLVSCQQPTHRYKRGGHEHVAIPIRVVDAQNGATTEEGAFALSRPLQAGAFNYTLNRDSDEDWYQNMNEAFGLGDY